MLRNRNSHRARSSLVALIAVLSLSACETRNPLSGGPEDSLPREVATPQPFRTQESANPPHDSTRAAVLSQYVAFWDAVTAASDPPNPDHPALAATAAGPQLEQLRRILSRYREQGYVRRGQARRHPTLRQILDGGSAAVVDDCSELDPEGGLFDLKTGKRVEGGGEPGNRELLETRLELNAGTWKVVNVNVVEENSACRPGAA
ncbi:MAG: hypothetical protein M3O70_05265 [Actinomycetota bacterium]|nr:hypothetical protein [Actinomycetota bacterium]